MVIKKICNNYMVSDEELYVILHSFYRSNDGVLISVIEKELKDFDEYKKEVVNEAIREGYLKKITNIRVILTKYGKDLWKFSEAEGLF